MILLRFIKIRKDPSNKTLLIKPGHLLFSSAEYREAMDLWIHYAQASGLQNELEYLQGDTTQEKPSKLLPLQPFVDPNGILRVGGRLQAALLPGEQIQPPILPKMTEAVEVYVLSLHRRNTHAGPETLLHIIRQNFWLLGGRREVKRIIRKCLCYRLRASKFHQSVAPLPEVRLRPSNGFETVGLDYAGPFIVSEAIDGKERAIKVWVLLITCLTTRAVHFEIVYAMDISSFINAFRRFIARRGYCRLVYCDNAPTFKKADREFKKLFQALTFEEAQRQLANVPHAIEFRYSPPKSPHYGGVWERLVGSMKKALKASLGRKIPDFDQFQTEVAMAESLINSRPLTVVSEDIKDALPITPAHLLLGRGLQTIPDDLLQGGQQDEVLTLWQQRQELSASFWKRWKREYLSTLQSFNKWLDPGMEPTLGEVVLLDEPIKLNYIRRLDGYLPTVAKDNKMFWQLAKIIKLHMGRDGRVRSVEVKLGSGKVFRRDLRHLYRLEIHSPTEIEEKEG